MERSGSPRTGPSGKSSPQSWTSPQPRLRTPAAYQGCAGMWHSQGWAEKGVPPEGSRSSGSTEQGVEQHPQAGKSCIPPLQCEGHSHHDRLQEACVLSRAGRKGLRSCQSREQRPGNSAADAGRRCAGEASLCRHSSVTVTLCAAASEPGGVGDQLSTTRGADQGPLLGCHRPRSAARVTQDHPMVLTPLLAATNTA